MKKYLIKKEDSIFIIVGLFFGFAINLFHLTNTLFNHDNLICASSGIGTTYPLGRWFLGFIGDEITKHGFNNNISYFYGYISIIIMCLVAYLLVKFFKIENTIIKYSILFLFITYPVFNGTMFYMFTMPWYMLAVSMSTLSAIIFFEAKKKYACVLSIILFVLSIAIYQAYIPYTITLYLIKLFFDTLDTEEFKLSIFFKKCFEIGMIFIISIVLYALLNNLILNLNGISLTDYQGANGMLELSLVGILNGVKNAYSNFFVSILRGTHNINEQLLTRVSTFVLIVLFIVLLTKDIIKMKKEKVSAFMLLLILFPLAVNFIYVMCGEQSNIYLLMKLGTIFIYMLPLIYIDRRIEQKILINGKVLLPICGVILFYNCYMAMYNQQAVYYANEQAKSFFNILYSRILSIDDYNYDYPIVITGDFDSRLCSNNYVKDNNGYTKMYDGVYESYIHTYSRTAVLRMLIGTSNDIIDYHYVDMSEIKNTKEFKEMGIYPEKNSIDVINEKIVIKTSE